MYLYLYISVAAAFFFFSLMLRFFRDGDCDVYVNVERDTTRLYNITRLSAEWILCAKYIDSIRELKN